VLVYNSLIRKIFRGGSRLARPWYLLLFRSARCVYARSPRYHSHGIVRTGR